MTHTCPVKYDIPKAPYIKPKFFLTYLIPIVLKGIPLHADSVRNPDCVGTLEYEDFWDKEFNKIVNGFWIGNIWIPGRFYYYMNYKHMSTIRGVITPDMVDMHLELAYYIEHCLANGKNLLCAKGRRKGISEAVSTMVVDYGWRFSEGFKAGIAAGKKVYTEDFVAKWRFSDSRLPPELSTKKLTDNDDEIVAGYQIKNQYNAFEDKGTMNTIYARTMHTDPNMFKGLYLNVIISEEVGEHENWISFYGASKDCLMSGNQQVGILIAFGTAGNINKGSKDFKKIWQDAETFNFVKYMIPADRFYYYGDARNENQRIPLESNLLKQHKAYQLIGYEDRELSLKNIMDRRAKLLKQGNLKEYNEDLQNNPINESEMFRKTVINKFNTNILNAQQSLIDNSPHVKYIKYKLSWKKDKGMIVRPLEVVMTLLENNENQDECVWIIDGEEPRNSYSNLYVAGIDSYDQDEAKASKSLGAMCVLIRDNVIPGALKKAPVAVICCRPRRKELFYEMCMQLSVLYGKAGLSYGNVLGDVANALIMEHFKDNGLWGYLAYRPTKFESDTSDQSHEKWVRFTTYSRPRRGALMQSTIEDFCENNIWFPDLIDQLGNFDELEVGSDNDLADAYGIALMQDISCETGPRDENDNDVPDRFALPKFKDGRIVQEAGTLKNIQQDSALFGMMFGKPD